MSVGFKKLGAPLLALLALCFTANKSRLKGERPCGMDFKNENHLDVLGFQLNTLHRHLQTEPLQLVLIHHRPIRKKSLEATRFWDGLLQRNN